MQSITENIVSDELDTQQKDYKYNFLNNPWDDRNRKSKIGIIGLLCAIFVVTMGVVISNFIIFYRGFQVRLLYSSSEIHCNLVRVDKYYYAARLHSISTQELICVGAVVSPSSVLANAVCLKSGAIRLYLGSLTNHRCKKGFSVEVTETIRHDGVVTRNLVLLITRESMIECGKSIKLGLNSIFNHSAFVIGRPFRGGRTLSFQPAFLAASDTMTFVVAVSLHNINKNNVICVKHFSKCPVRAGDLLVQKGRLIGIASTSTHIGDNTEIACFANLSIIHEELKYLDNEVIFDLIL